LNQLPSALCRVKIEIRSSKSETKETVKVRIQKLEIRDELVWNFLRFEHLDLFRISEFEFSSLVFMNPWRETIGIGTSL